MEHISIENFNLLYQEVEVLKKEIELQWSKNILKKKMAETIIYYTKAALYEDFQFNGFEELDLYDFSFYTQNDYEITKPPLCLSYYKYLKVEKFLLLALLENKNITFNFKTLLPTQFNFELPKWFEEAVKVADENNNIIKDDFEYENTNFNSEMLDEILKKVSVAKIEQQNLGMQHIKECNICEHLSTLHHHQ